MGHQAHLKGPYLSLLERLNAGTVGLPRPENPEALRGWQELLEIFYSPDEAETASRMPIRPSSLKAIARRFGEEPAVFEPKLEAMCRKGLVMDLTNPKTGERLYLLAPPVVGFFEFSLMRVHGNFPQKELSDAMHSYVTKDAAFFREVFGHDTVIGRSLVHGEKVADDAEVLVWEKAANLVEDAEKIAVSLCYCRHKAEHVGKNCDAPQEICISLNAGANYITRRDFGTSIDRIRALEILHEAKERRLVQIVDNVQKRPTWLCNCCGCCCGQLTSISKYGLRGVNPSGYLPAFDDERCKGCAKCSRACPVAAITMVPLRHEGSRKTQLQPEVKTEVCIGCGVCSLTCSRSVISMQRDGNGQRIVPENTMEQVVRFAIEKGRLHHLLFDAGESMGSAVMNRILGALFTLPPMDRLMAARSVQSLFVSQALKAASREGLDL